ncbi:MAG: hypothetical protein IJU45_02335 [Clostridia bacterium]|nr:hypothetical protein [Clostridia bacterium]
MKTAKKSLAVLLAAIIIMSSFAAGFSAFAAEERAPIHRVDITLRTDLAGKDFWDYNYDEVFTVTSPNAGYPSQDINGTPARAFYKDGRFADTTYPGKKYEFHVYVQADDSYYFADDVEVYINGEKSAQEVQRFNNNQSLYVNCGERRVTTNWSLGVITRLVYYFDVLAAALGLAK